MSSTCPHNMAHFGPLTAEICCRVWGHPSKFQRVSRVSSLLQRRHLSEANLTLHDVWQSPIYTFLRALAPWRNFARWKIHFTSKSCVLLYWQRYCTALQQRAALSQTMRRGTRNGITSLLQRAPTIFGWAAITLGIGPHSSSGRLCNRADHYIFALWFVSSFFPRLISAAADRMFTILPHMVWP